MTKSETMQQLAAAANEEQLAAMGEQIEHLRQAKLCSAEELAAALEPLAQAMAALTDQTRQSLVQIEKQGRDQARELREQTEKALMACQNAELAARDAAGRLEVVVEGIAWRHYLIAILTGLATGMLVTVFLLWRASPHAMVYTLNAKEVAELLRPEIAALRPRKGK